MAVSPGDHPLRQFEHQFGYKPSGGYYAQAAVSPGDHPLQRNRNTTTISSGCSICLAYFLQAKRMFTNAPGMMLRMTIFLEFDGELIQNKGKQLLSYSLLLWDT